MVRVIHVASQQGADEPGTLVGGQVGDESAGLLRARQEADEVEGDAPEEGGVIGARGAR